MDNEQITEKNICTFCGAENPENAKFCEQCGKRIDGEKPKKSCPVCNLEYESTVKYCNQCGTPLFEEGEKIIKDTPPTYEKPKRKKMTRERKYNIVKSSLILFVSVLLLAFSFLPIVNYEISEINGSPISPPASVDLTAIDHIIFLFDSMEELTEEEMEKDEMTKEAQSLYVSLMYSSLGSYTGLSEDSQEILADLFKLSLRMGFRSDKESVTVTTLYMAVLCLAYMVFTVALFGFALYQFIRVILGKEVSYKLLTTLLCLAPFMILAVIITSTGSIAYIATSMSFSLPALIVSILAGCGLVVDSYIFGKKPFEIVKLVRGSVCAILAAICMCLTLSSAFSTKLMGEFKGSDEDEEAETTLIADNYQAFEMNDIAISEYDETEDRDIRRSIKKIFSKYTKTDIENGKADFEIQELALLIAYRSMGSDMLSFASIYYLGVVVMLICGIIGWLSLCSLCDGEERKKTRLSLFIAALCTSAIYLILNISFVSTCNSMISKVELSEMVSFSISLTPIVSLVMLALMIAVILNFVKQRKAPAMAENILVSEKENEEINKLFDQAAKEEPMDTVEDTTEEEPIESFEDATEEEPIESLEETTVEETKEETQE